MVPPYSMTHYKTYTRNQCLFECLMKKVHAECKCSAPYFKNEWQTGNRTKKICSFSQHADCVAPILEHFNYGGCICPHRCERLGKATAFKPNFYEKLQKLIMKQFNMANIILVIQTGEKLQKLIQW